MLRIIGDVHGQVREYQKITSHVSHSVQVGDMGFREEYAHINRHVDGRNHRFVAGNHDDYDNLPNHALGDFGEEELGGVQFFYVRGAESIDKAHRIEGLSWWRDEEIGIEVGRSVISAYARSKPSMVISHDCPTQALPSLVINDGKENCSRTNQLLGRLFEIHQPKMWFFGHHHQTKSKVIGGCIFQCLDELDWIDIGG
jgi:predicted phosphodiesterase